jgi:hypothetical protein
MKLSKSTVGLQIIKNVWFIRLHKNRFQLNFLFLCAKFQKKFTFFKLCNFSSELLLCINGYAVASRLFLITWQAQCLYFGCLNFHCDCVS